MYQEMEGEESYLVERGREGGRNGCTVKREGEEGGGGEKPGYS